MHLVVPFAAPLSEAARPVLQSLSLPVLEGLLPQLGHRTLDAGDEWSLSPPHERVLARELGLAGADGALPWAAREAVRHGLDPADLAWGLLTPVHLHVGTEQVSLLDPASLRLDDDESHALFAAVEDLFTSEGFTLAWLDATRWLAAHGSLLDLPTASLDRVIGRNVDRWLPDIPAARLIRRLQNEVQMLLYTHPINEGREARGLLPVNSLWLSGCGRRQAAAQPPGLAVDDRLRGPALAEDWAAWAEAWRALDAGPLAALNDALRRGEPATLTLCGERAAVRLEPAARSLWQRLIGGSRAPRPAELLEPL
ncbi:MAG: hypothetical protein MUC32_03865 [Burkholderiaceae bacterium]|jgi:hypothetical protein|nr:hypothetical protein [Burkholderiaceae bacterium]